MRNSQTPLQEAPPHPKLQAALELLGNSETVGQFLYFESPPDASFSRRIHAVPQGASGASGLQTACRRKVMEHWPRLSLPWEELPAGSLCPLCIRTLARRERARRLQLSTEPVKLTLRYEKPEHEQLLRLLETARRHGLGPAKDEEILLSALAAWVGAEGNGEKEAAQTRPAPETASALAELSPASWALQALLCGRLGAQQPSREQAAEQYDQAAEELEAAVQHLRATARHFRAGDVPRGCAHAWAASGQVHVAEEVLKALSMLHAARSRR